MEVSDLQIGKNVIVRLRDGSVLDRCCLEGVVSTESNTALILHRPSDFPNVYGKGQKIMLKKLNKGKIEVRGR